MKSEEYLLGKIPKEYITHIDKKNRILYLNDEKTEGYIWDTKIKYWTINLSINHGYTIKYTNDDNH